MESKFWIAVALMVSTVAGAAVLGFPYIFSKIGFITGVATILLVGTATTLMTLYLAEMSLNEKKEYLISGFAKKYFGKKGKIFTLLTETFGIYAALIAYLIAIGIALGDMFNADPLLMGTAFFVIAAGAILFGFKRFNKLDLSVAILKIVMLISFIFILIPSAKITPQINVFSPSLVLLPFGIVLFASLGYNFIPEMKKILGKDKKRVTTAIVAAMAIVFLIYVLFSYVFISSGNTNEISVVGMSQFRLLGDLFVLVAMAVPFVALADAIKHVYTSDMGVDNRLSWFLSVFIPFLIYVYTNMGFIAFLQISGAYAGGLMGLLTMFMALKARKNKKYKRLIPGGNIPIYYSIFIFTLGIVYTTAVILLAQS
jgi:amino acid permease